MYIRNNKGITLIALIITVILMLILAGVSVSTGIDSYKNAQVTRFISQMQLIQEKVDNIKKEEGLLLGTAVTSDQQTSIVYRINEEHLINCAEQENPFSNWRYFYKEKLLSDLDLEGINGDIFINFQTREVISLTGVYYTKDKKTHYTQYSLPGGQQLVQNVGVNSILGFSAINDNLTINGLNATIKITEVTRDENPITNGIIKYKLTNQSANSTYEAYDQDTIGQWQKVNGDTIIISQSGNYVFVLSDDLGSDPCIQYTTIILTNAPKLLENMIKVNSLNYSELGSEESWNYNYQYTQEGNSSANLRYRGIRKNG